MSQALKGWYNIRVDDWSIEIVFDDVSKAFINTETLDMHDWGTTIEKILSALSYESMHT